MIKRRISILAVDEKIADFFREELYSIFNNIFEIRYYTTSMTPLPYIYDSDLVLYTDPSILIKFMNNIKCNCPVLMMKRTISKFAVNEISTIPANSHCLVANINSFMANETLTTIYQLGFKNIQLTPFYKGVKWDPENNHVDYIICHEDYKFMKNIKAKRIIIGNRIFDINTILDILAILDVDSKLAEKIILKYSLRIPNMWKGVNYTLENKRILSSQWKILLNELSSAVMVVDEKDRITVINSNVFEMFDENMKDYENLILASLVEKYPSLNILMSNDDLENELFVYNGKKLIITIKKVTFNDNYYGKIILIKSYTDVVDVQQKIHKKIIGKGYYSKHTFASIVGKDEIIKDRIEICKKISNVNASVLIYGESGTGKELFAGAIHNYSSRKNDPFVAVNCATLPENLLESELFGYEEGAFTGAKKGGKIGLFESAHNGTLFLDEIGEIPLNLQARLLRVLQEKEIMRVGGNSIIKVDTKIITATNKDLLKMVEDGKFRKDLFYRLNVFQVDLPPLRARSNDITLLIENYLSFKTDKKILTNTFVRFCENYSWPGNIRELHNVLEYMNAVAGEVFSIDYLPSYLKKREYLDFEVTRNKLHSTELFILKIIRDFNDMKKNAGRRSICNHFCKKYFKISEVEVRQKIDFLLEKGFISVTKGPKGCELLELGFELLLNS